MCKKREIDWCDLLPELVVVISKKIPGLCDFIRFRATCKRWRSLVPLSDAPSQLPWLMEVNGDACAIATNLQAEHRFYSAFTGETGTIFVKPSCQGKSFRGPSPGHLLLSSGEFTNLRKSCHLFNPLTEEEVWLPPLTCSLGWPVFSSGFESWAFFDPYTLEWSATARRADSQHCCNLKTLIVSSGVGVTTEFFGESTRIKWDEIPPPIEETQLDTRCVSSHIMDTGRDLLRVSLYSRCCKNTEHCAYFRIYKLGFEENNCVWEEISSIDDRVLFLDVVDAFSISAEPFPAALGGFVIPNSIYFLSPDDCKPYRYDIQRGFVQRLPCPFQKCIWFLPTLRIIGP
ncbi:F-box domain-containing protein [Rhynchospora pubera]|uniref:F-box domain-containing protein n=1 Tax=Rhynchospora pubera TaxID=906938 RepID=A0AAV8HTL7_9POAL|nr:F-box domain-containing protein [Rhynchospora pubera]